MPSLDIDKLCAQFTACRAYQADRRFRDAVAGFKACQHTARDLLLQGESEEGNLAALRKLEMESCRGKANSYLSLPRKDRAYESFEEALGLARAYKDRVAEAYALIGMSAAYDNKGVKDGTKADLSRKAHGIASEVYATALRQYEEEAPPLLLPPFGERPAFVTLRNKLFTGEVAPAARLDQALAVSQKLLTRANDAIGKANKVSW